MKKIWSIVFMFSLFQAHVSHAAEIAIYTGLSVVQVAGLYCILKAKRPAADRVLSSRYNQVHNRYFSEPEIDLRLNGCLCAPRRVVCCACGRWTEDVSDTEYLDYGCETCQDVCCDCCLFPCKPRNKQRRARLCGCGVGVELPEPPSIPLVLQRRQRMREPE